MAVRFRIRTSAGQELSFASHETFEDFVRSGDLSPDDLVYDGETGSWSPARTHPTVLEIEYEREAEAEAEATGAAATEPTGPAGTEPEAPPVASSPERAGRTPEPGDAPPDDEAAAEKDVEAFGLELAPVEERTPDQEARAFVERMEAERESDLAGSGSGRIEGFTLQDSSTLADMLEPAPEPEAPHPSPPPAPARPAASRRPGPRDEPARREARSGRAKASGREHTESRPEPSGGGRRLLAAILATAILGGGAYVGYRMWTDGTGQQGPAPEGGPAVEPDVAVEAVAAEAVPPAPVREPVIAATEAAVRERARERFLTTTQSALRDLRAVPDAWASGPYLAVPTGYPEVVDVWQSYLSTVGRVRAMERERYRTAYLSALDDAAVEGDARASRLAAAMADFTASADVRSAHWDRVEALATAALQSHNALVEAEGLLLYDAGGTTDGLGSGVSGRDADAQLLLRQVVELLSSRLEADGLGPGDGGRVREWVWDGFLDAVTR